MSLPFCQTPKNWVYMIFKILFESTLLKFNKELIIQQFLFPKVVSYQTPVLKILCSRKDL